MTVLDLNLLRVLEAMFTQGTVSAAAQTLGLTQPGMSIALRRLRKHFADELFVRQGGTMVPTALAERLREPVTRTIATIQAEIVPVGNFEPMTSRRCFSISLSDLGDLVFLPDLVALLRQRAPGVSIKSVSVDPPEMLHGLADGSIDLAIGHLTRIDTTSYFEQTLFEQPFVCLTRAGHPETTRDLSLDQFLDAEHIIVTQEGRSQERFERRVKELGYQRRIVLQSPHFMSVPLMVAQSDMITVVPLAVGRIYARLLGLRMHRLPFEIPAVELRQFWHRRAHADPDIVWLRKQVSELFVGRDPTGATDSSFWATYADRLVSPSDYP